MLAATVVCATIYTMERDRKRSHSRKNKYIRLIEAKRDELSDDDMEVLLTVYEQPSLAHAAEELGVSIEELESRLNILFPPKIDTRVTKNGEKYAKRLTDTAIKSILAEHEDLGDDERELLSALIGARNQVIAATSLDMNFSTFIGKYKSMRRKHGF